MNYFQRLMRRANAECCAKRNKLFDPFSGSTFVEAVWPETSPTHLANRKDIEQTVETKNNVNTSEYSVSPLQVESTAIKQSFEEKIISRNSEKIPTELVPEDSKVIRESDSPKILNEESPYSILDHIMEPYIQSNADKPDYKESGNKRSKSLTKNLNSKQSKPVVTHLLPENKSESVFTGKTENPVKTPTQIMPTPRSDNLLDHKKKKENKQRKENDSVKSQTKTQTEQSTQQKYIERRTEYVIVNAAKSERYDSADFVSGSPGIGIGQL